MAQSKSANQVNHEQAVNKLMELYPNAQKVDIDQLKREQKDQHKTCNTCNKSRQHSSSTGDQQLSLAELESNKARLENLISFSDGNDQQLVAKYKQALAITDRKIRLAKGRLYSENKSKQSTK